MNLSTSERQRVSDIGRAVGGALLALIILAVIGVGGWRVGWWFKEQNVERQAHIYRKSYANQERLREDISEKLGTVLTIEAQISGLDPRADSEEIAALTAQAKAVTSIACHDAAQVSGDELAPEQSAFIEANCQLGSVAP
jgi:predicted negative regulator of RcsB-dependent stress response